MNQIPIAKNKEELLKALTEVGFVAIDPSDWVSNYDPYLIQSAYGIAREFFSKSQEYKQKFYIEGSAGQVGYTGERKETAKGATVPDLKEFLHVHADFQRWVATEVGGPGLHHFASTLSETYQNMLNLGYAVIDAIAETTGLNELSTILGDKNSILRLLHYPPTGDAPIGERAAAHEDINLITLLPAASAGGLEVLRKDGEWLDVPTDKDLVIINVGDQLQEYSRGLLKSTTHRVVNTIKGRFESRYSIPFFLHPPGDFRLSERYTAKEYLEERLKELGLK